MWSIGSPSLIQPGEKRYNHHHWSRQNRRWSKTIAITISSKDGGIVLSGSAIVARKRVLFAVEMEHERLISYQKGRGSLPKGKAIRYVTWNWLARPLATRRRLTDTIRCRCVCLVLPTCSRRNTDVVKARNAWHGIGFFLALWSIHHFPCNASSHHGAILPIISSHFKIICTLTDMQLLVPNVNFWHKLYTHHL